MTAVLSQYAANVRDIAILLAAALALLSFGLSLRTRVDTDRGHVVVWRLPLLRHVKVEGQEIRRPSPRELAEESDDDNESTPADGGQNATTSPAEATPAAVEEAAPGDTVKPDADEQQTKASGWFHVPAAMDRSRDPVDLPVISLSRAGRSGRTQLHLRAKRSDQGPLSQYPNIRVNQSSEPAADVHIPLTDSDAGRVHDAIVGSWVTNLWS